MEYYPSKEYYYNAHKLFTIPEEQYKLMQSDILALSKLVKELKLKLEDVVDENKELKEEIKYLVQENNILQRHI